MASFKFYPKGPKVSIVFHPRRDTSEALREWGLAFRLGKEEVVEEKKKELTLKPTEKIDADTLEGHPASFFAPASDLTITFSASRITPGTFGGETDYTFPGNLKIKGGQIHLTPIEVGVTTEGTVYYDTDDDNLYVYISAGFVDLTTQGETITAGAGLTKTGSTLAVGAGTGITVNADDVALNLTYADGRYLTEDSADTMNANLTMGSSATLYFAGGTTYYIDSSGHAKFNNLTAVGTISLLNDSITDAM